MHDIAVLAAVPGLTRGKCLDAAYTSALEVTIRRRGHHHDQARQQKFSRPLRRSSLIQKLSQSYCVLSKVSHSAIFRALRLQTSIIKYQNIIPACRI